MDCISNQIEISFKIDKTKKVKKELILSKNYKLLAEVEGELEIYVNHNLFFSDEYILLLEFGVALSRWIRNLRNNKLEGFEYTAMDYNDGPILEFILEEKNIIIIHSEWEIFKSEEHFNLQDVRITIEKFIDKLTKGLQMEYGINLNDFE